MHFTEDCKAIENTTLYMDFTVLVWPKEQNNFNSAIWVFYLGNSPIFSTQKVRDRFTHTKINPPHTIQYCLYTKI